MSKPYIATQIALYYGDAKLGGQETVYPGYQRLDCPYGEDGWQLTKPAGLMGTISDLEYRNKLDFVFPKVKGVFSGRVNNLVFLNSLGQPLYQMEMPLIELRDGLSVLIPRGLLQIKVKDILVTEIEHER